MLGEGLTSVLRVKTPEDQLKFCIVIEVQKILTATRADANAAVSAATEEARQKLMHWANIHPNKKAAETPTDANEEHGAIVARNLAESIRMMLKTARTIASLNAPTLRLYSSILGAIPPTSTAGKEKLVMILTSYFHQNLIDRYIPPLPPKEEQPKSAAAKPTKSTKAARVDTDDSAAKKRRKLVDTPPPPLPPTPPRETSLSCSSEVGGVMPSPSPVASTCPTDADPPTQQQQQQSNRPPSASPSAVAPSEALVRVFGSVLGSTPIAPLSSIVHEAALVPELSAVTEDDIAHAARYLHSACQVVYDAEQGMLYLV
eukprot:PhM_4_TR8329/c0_g1_i1/m.21759